MFQKRLFQRSIFAALILVLLAMDTGLAKNRPLKPIVATGQSIATREDGLVVLIDTKNDIEAGATMSKDDTAFFVSLYVQNHTKGEVTVEQEKFFLLNAYDRPLYRMSEYEVRRYWAEIAHLPPPPPTKQSQYTVTPDGAGGYVVRRESDWSDIGESLGASLRTMLDRRNARKQIEMIDKSYFRNGTIQPEKAVIGSVHFYAIDVSPKTPVTLVIEVGGTIFKLVFTE